MKSFLVFAALVAVVSGQYDYTGPQRQNNGGSRPVYGPPQREFEEPQPPPRPLPPQQPQPQQPPQQQQPEAYTPQVFRHIYIHAFPDEPVDEQARTIRVPGGDKHVNIIFVRTPSQSSSQQTEVILPEQDEQKNLVYVLLKKNTAENNIRIRRPPPQRQQKPEVYFIRYKDQEEQKAGGYSQGPQNGGGAPPASVFQSAQPEVRAPAPAFQSAPESRAPAPPARNNGGNNDGYSEAGRYIPAVAPGPIRSPSDVPSSGYGAPV